MENEIKISKNGLSYYVLSKDEVNKLNEGVEYMQYVKGLLEWDENSKYLLIPGTGSMVLRGTINESDDEILNDWLGHYIK